LRGEKNVFRTIFLKKASKDFVTMKVKKGHKNVSIPHPCLLKNRYAVVYMAATGSEAKKDKLYKKK
jgi:hypothetical protein